jgi:hypothetical protein
MTHGKRIMAALKAYFDDSGKENDPQHKAVSYGGYIGTTDAWTKFEPCWKEVLDKFDAPYLHMKEFVPCEGAFSGWRDKQEKKAFLIALIDVIEKSGLEWVAHAIDLDGLKKLNREFGLSLEAEPLALYVCFLEIEDRFGDEVVIEATLDRISKPYVLIKKVRDLAKYESRNKMVGENIDLQPLHKCLTFRDVLPLQAADFIANESLKFTRKRIEIGIDEAISSQRKSFKALISHPGRGGFWSYKSLLSLHNSRGGAWPGTEEGNDGVKLRKFSKFLKKQPLNGDDG